MMLASTSFDRPNRQRDISFAQGGHHLIVDLLIIPARDFIVVEPAAVVGLEIGAADCNIRIKKNCIKDFLQHFFQVLPCE